MLTLEALPESCTAEEAVTLLPSLAERLVIAGEPPSLRTLRLWRSRKMLSRAGRRLTRKNLLEALGIMRLRSDGLTAAAAAEKCMALSEDRLWLFLTAPPAAPASQTTAFARDTLLLLAKGILEQYQLVTHGAIVGHTDDRRTGVENTSLALWQASARLGRLYFEEGHEDVAASFHALLDHCTKPLRDWAPRAVWSLPEAADAMLIDGDYRVPSEDCEVIAQQTQGTSLEDLIEKRLHNDLTQTLGKLGDDADAAYTTIREFVGRHPLATSAELNGLYAQPELNNAAIEFVQRLYTQVHADVATQGQVQRCHFCNAPVGRDGKCMLQGCRQDHPHTELAKPVPLEEARVAAPEVLKYWADPAREELRLYDELRKAGIIADLYPHVDRCDVAIGDEVGVDVKDYRDPVRLARKLNLGIGGLLHYPRSILAVADRRARYGDYIDRLREQLSSENQQRLELMSVSDAIRALTRDFQRRRGGRARQT
jgi:hypothetical protein